MRRMTRGNEEDLVEPERLARLTSNGQVTVVYGVETAAEKAETKGCQSAEC